MTVRLRPLAAAEVADARNWYDRQRHGLGDDYERELRVVIDAIERGPRTFPFVDGSTDIRRALLPRFPYGVFYVEGADVVVVLAVAHLRREPGYWKGR
jgi:toxin ParE1/3/4